MSAVLSWLGIIGGAITVFSSLETLLKLADWARWLVDTWKRWVVVGWDWFLSLLPFDLTMGARFQMTMALMIICLAVGAYLSSRARDNQPRSWSPGLHNIATWNVAIAVAIFATHAWFFGHYIASLRHHDLPPWFWQFQEIIIYGTYASAIFIGLLHWPLIAAMVGTAGSVIFSQAFQAAAQTLQSNAHANEIASLLVGSGFTIFAGLLVLYVAPPKMFARRLWFLIVGLVILMGMNELSRLGIDITAPATRA